MERRVRRTSAISWVALFVGAACQVISSAPAQAQGPAGNPGDIQTNNGAGGFGASHLNDSNGTVNANEDTVFHSGVPEFDVRSFCATGDPNQYFGSMTSGSSTLTTTTTSDFAACPANSGQSGPGIYVELAGGKTSLAVPTGLTVTVEGTTGSTTYQYQVACIDTNAARLNSSTAATSAVSVTNGNATLDGDGSGNWNKLTWTNNSSCGWYAVYGRTSGSMMYIGESEPGPNATTAEFDDLGANENPYYNLLPTEISSTPPASAQSGSLLTYVASGFGTTTLTLGANAGNTVSSESVYHSDGAAIQAAINAVPTTVVGNGGLGGAVMFGSPSGGKNSYLVWQPLTMAANQRIYYGCQSHLSYQGCGIAGGNYGTSIFLITKGIFDTTWADIQMQGGAWHYHFVNGASEVRVAWLGTAEGPGGSGVRLEGGSNMIDGTFAPRLLQTDGYGYESVNGVTNQGLIFGSSINSTTWTCGKRCEWVRLGQLGGGDNNIKLQNIVAEGPPNNNQNFNGAVEMGGARQIEFDNFQLADWQAPCPSSAASFFGVIFDPGGNAPAFINIVSSQLGNNCGNAFTTHDGNTGAVNIIGSNVGSGYSGGFAFGGGNGWININCYDSNIAPAPITSGAGQIGLEEISGCQYSGTGQPWSIYDGFPGQANPTIASNYSGSINLAKPPIATGVAATLTGTGPCATRSSQLGGSWGGAVSCTGTTGAATLVITPGPTAAHGFNCYGSDETAGVAGAQSGNSTSTCTLKFTSVTASDMLSFTVNQF
jgi:hypothetical protein